MGFVGPKDALAARVGPGQAAQLVCASNSLTVQGMGAAQMATASATMITSVPTAASANVPVTAAATVLVSRSAVSAKKLSVGLTALKRHALVAAYMDFVTKRDSVFVRLGGEGRIAIFEYVPVTAEPMVIAVSTAPVSATQDLGGQRVI